MRRVEFFVEVDVDTDDEAGVIAEAIYARFAKDFAEIEGVKWLFPVATIKPDPNAALRVETSGHSPRD